MKNIMRPRVAVVFILVVLGFFLWWTLLRTTEVIDTVAVGRGDIEVGRQ
ncbi:hypothetical protein ACVBGC_32310 [Burkholderia stagnalis]